jgi:hypothetical protein
MKELLKELGFKNTETGYYHLNVYKKEDETGGMIVYNDSKLYIYSGLSSEDDYAFSIRIEDTEEGRDNLKKIVELLTK